MFTAPGREYVPDGHGSMLMGVRQKLLAGQGLHSERLLSPPIISYVPAGQSTTVNACGSHTLPRGHLVQLSLVSVAVSPGRQNEQRVDPGGANQACPFGQAEQLPAVLITLKDPEGHKTHLFEEVGAYFPGVQLMQ